MMQTHDPSEELSVAVLTVNLGPDTTELVRASAATMRWKPIAVDFENYFVGGKAPYIGHKAIEAPACVAVIDFDKNSDLALATAESLRHIFYHQIAIIGLSSATHPDLLMRAMRAGCREFLKKPFDASEFELTLGRLHAQWSAARPRDAGRVLSFFGAKGGVGTTTLAVHMAMFLVKDFQRKVLLIDNHRQLGHVALYLGIDGARHTFQELVGNFNRLDQELLRGFIATHPAGLDILSSPDVYGGQETRETTYVESTLEFLSSHYDFVLIDCEASFEDINLAIIDLSDWVYLIASPEIGAIRDLSRYVDGLNQNEHASAKLQVVINRYSSKDAVTIAQIEKAVRLPIAFKIENDYGALVKSINIGQPISSERKSEFSRQMKKWAASVLEGDAAPVEAPPRKKRGLW